MKFAICQELFVDWDWERQCRFIAETGYTGIEIAPFTLAPRITDVPLHRRHQLRQQAEDAGLEVVGLHWLLAKTEGLHLTSSDAAVQKATGHYLAELAHGCADLGGRVLVLGSPQQRNFPPEMSRAQAHANALTTLQHCLPALHERDVELCLEPLTPRETNFMLTCAEAVELIEALGDSQVRLHQDVKAMLSESKRIPELIAEYASYVGHFHVNDSNLLGPGMGPTEYEPIFRALLASQYAGWVSVEVFDYSPGAEKIARDSLSYMREVLARVSRARS